MEAARLETRRHLDRIHRQIEIQAERLTVAAKARNRTHKRSGVRWTQSDERLFQAHIESLTFERRNEIGALTRKLARQDQAIVTSSAQQKERLRPTAGTQYPHDYRS